MYLYNKILNLICFFSSQCWWRSHNGKVDGNVGSLVCITSLREVAGNPKVTVENFHVQQVFQYLLWHSYMTTYIAAQKGFSNAESTIGYRFQHNVPYQSNFKVVCPKSRINNAAITGN